MQGFSEELFFLIWQVLLQLSEGLEVISIFCNFDKDMIASLRRAFPDSLIRGLWLHFGQVNIQLPDVSCVTGSYCLHKIDITYRRCVLKNVLKILFKICNSSMKSDPKICT